VRIVRDPRDVALSLVKVPWGPPDFESALWRCRRDDEATYRFFERDRLSTTVFFERVVGDPKAELIRLCEFLGESFEEGMLDTEKSAARISRAEIVANARQPIKPDRARAWTCVLSQDERRLASKLLRNQLKRYEYDRDRSSTRGSLIDKVFAQVKGWIRK
jgi:hypothetical protein